MGEVDANISEENEFYNLLMKIDDDNYEYVKPLVEGKQYHFIYLNINIFPKGTFKN